MLFEKIELEPTETILKIVRKHWFVIFSQLLSTVLIMFVIPSLLAFIMNSAVMQEMFGDLHRFDVLTGYLLTLWLLGNVLVIFTIWTHYYLDLWVVTNQRIIVIDQISFFNRKVSSFRLERLQDIMVSVNGIIPTFLDFGTLHAHTAGNNEENFTSTNLPAPRDLQAMIQKATDERFKTIGQMASLVNNV